MEIEKIWKVCVCVSGGGGDRGGIPCVVAPGSTA